MVKKRPGHIPERTCAGCGIKAPKSEFLRVVRTPEGELVVAGGEKIYGRSVYLCPKKGCIEAGKKKIEKILKVKISSEERERIFSELLDLASTQGEDAS